MYLYLHHHPRKGSQIATQKTTRTTSIKHHCEAHPSNGAGRFVWFPVFFFEKALIEILVIVDINVNMQATLTLIDGDCDNLNFYLYDLIYGIICTCVSSISD